MAAFRGRIHGCNRTIAETSDSSLAPRAPSIHGTQRHLAALQNLDAIGGEAEVVRALRARRGIGSFANRSIALLTARLYVTELRFWEAKGTIVTHGGN